MTDLGLYYFAAKKGARDKILTKRVRKFLKSFGAVEKKRKFVRQKRLFQQTLINLFIN